ncbi:hypothetical protein JR316_0007529 [Psilocybe cubensis]|uniref:Uncharacterized protein n=1 Tax=Psilocybe cubensis TaxID=181762 RepID=A0ACB8H0A9_PSICU|nr:hypothetical protein JR316_0007529 [Psilocybe cubensis]KAH9480926.1 hypothetical protein JR316_0007529 [Psilocybe cubensis]
MESARLLHRLKIHRANLFGYNKAGSTSVFSGLRSTLSKCGRRQRTRSMVRDGGKRQTTHGNYAVHHGNPTAPVRLAPCHNDKHGQRTCSSTAYRLRPDDNARHRLAVAQIKLGDIKEGKICIPHRSNFP